MEVRHERDAAGLTTVVIDVPVEVVEDVYQKAVRELKRHVTVPGFRRGKVPPKMVESILGPAAIADYAKDRLQEQVYPEAMRELATLVTLDDPNLELDHLERGKPTQLTVKVLTAAVDLGDWEGVAVNQFRAEVTPEEAAAEWDRYVGSNSEFAAADHTDVRAGDFVVFGLRIVRDGYLVEEYTADEPLRVEIGNNALNPSIDEHLLGLSAGQSSTFPVTYPEDYENEDLRGATAEFTVDIVAVETRESETAFLQRLGVHETREAALAATRESMVAYRENLYRIHAREEAIEKLLAAARMDIPRAFLESEIMDEIEDFEERLADRGVDLEGPEQERIETEEQQIRERVEQDTRREIYLRALAQVEQLEITQEDLIRELSMISQYNRVDPRVLMKRLEENGELAGVARNARLRKAAELVIERATITVVDPPAAESEEGHDHDHDHGHDSDSADQAAETSAEPTGASDQPAAEAKE